MDNMASVPRYLRTELRAHWTGFDEEERVGWGRAGLPAVKGGEGGMQRYFLGGLPHSFAWELTPRRSVRAYD